MSEQAAKLVLQETEHFYRLAIKRSAELKAKADAMLSKPYLCANCKYDTRTLEKRTMVCMELLDQKNVPSIFHPIYLDFTEHKYFCNYFCLQTWLEATELGTKVNESGATP